MSDNEHVQIIWTLDPADPEKVPFVYMARDVPSIEEDPKDWYEEIAAVVADKGHQHVRVTEVTVDFEAVRKSFDPMDVSVKPKITTSTMRGVGVLPVGTSVSRAPDGFLYPGVN